MGVSQEAVSHAGRERTQKLQLKVQLVDVGRPGEQGFTSQNLCLQIHIGLLLTLSLTYNGPQFSYSVSDHPGDKKSPLVSLPAD